MDKINTVSRYEYIKLFDADTDNEKPRSKKIGIDSSGEYILHISGSDTEDEYYILTTDEFRKYLDIARKDHRVSWLKYRRLLNDIPKTSSKNISSFEKITFGMTGMRGSIVYEIIPDNDTAVITQNEIRYSNSVKELVPVSRVSCSTEKALKLLNECNLLCWNGFHGAHPRGVKDGTMFFLEASVNGGITIKASGSQNFPKHYRDFRDGLNVLLKTETPVQL